MKVNLDMVLDKTLANLGCCRPCPPRTFCQKRSHAIAGKTETLAFYFERPSHLV
jgi:hypothetical protein